MNSFRKQAAPNPQLTKTILSALAGSAGTSLGMDTMMHPGESFLGGEWDKTRIANFTLNALLGAGGGAALSKGQLHEGGALIGLAPAKDLMMSLQSTVSKGNEVLDATATKLKNPPTAATDGTAKLNDTFKWIGGGALGLGGLALLAKLLKKNKKSESAGTQGTLKYKILGRKDDPNDDIEVELPIDTEKFSPGMNMQLDNYMRRQAQKAIKNNMRKKDPETGKLITYEEYVKKYGNMKSASFDNGLTDKPVPSYTTEETETPSTTREFYRLQAGAKLNNSGATVKSARAFHEGAGTMLTGLAGAGAGALLGKQIASTNPLLGMLAGGAIGGLAPMLGGKAVAALQESDRSEEEQAAHDTESAGLEYLVPGYAAYNSARRKDVKTTGNSFAATGMNPIQESYGTTLEDAVIADEAEPYDIIDKYASAAPPPPAPAPAPPAPAQDGSAQPPPAQNGSAPPPSNIPATTDVGAGQGNAVVKNKSHTAVTNTQLSSMQDVMAMMRDILSKSQHTQLA